jgi:NADPH:quinone reductase-like Zn-dependent oxidoreductase
VVAVPEDVDAVTAAALSYAYGTSFYALRDRAGLRPGETVLVLGARRRRLGRRATGKLMGARVIAAASPGKLETTRDAGADASVDYRQEGWRDRVRELIGSTGGVDVVYDPVGGPYSEPACAHSAGAAATSSSASPPGKSRASRSTSRCSRAAASSACPTAPSPSGSRTPTGR